MAADDGGHGGPRSEGGLHHALPYGNDRVYGGWWDGGPVCLDVTDKERPTVLNILGSAGQRDTHWRSGYRVRDLLVVTDEANRSLERDPP